MQLHFGGLQGEDQSIRSSYKFLGIISLFHLLLTIGVQMYSFKQKQRARQEWKLHRNLAHQKYDDFYLLGRGGSRAGKCGSFHEQGEDWGHTWTSVRT